MSAAVSETYIQLVLQLDAANAAAADAKKALADHLAAEERASLMEMRTEIKRRPDAHALLEWIEQRLTGDIRVVLNDYFVAMDEIAEADELGSEQDLHGRLAAAEHDVAELLGKNMELLHERALGENAAIDEASAEQAAERHTPDPVVQQLLTDAIEALEADTSLIPWGAAHLPGLRYALHDHDDEPCPVADGECWGVITAREILSAAAAGGAK